MLDTAKAQNDLAKHLEVISWNILRPINPLKDIYNVWGLYHKALWARNLRICYYWPKYL